MTTYAPLAASPGSFALAGVGVGRTVGTVIAERVNTPPRAPNWSWGAALTGGVNMPATDLPNYAFFPGAAIIEIVRMHLADAETLTYGQIVADALRLHEYVKPAVPVSVVETVNAADVLNVLRAVTVLEQLALQHTQIPSAQYGVALVHSVQFNDQLAKFLGGELTDGVGVQHSQLVNFYPIASIADGVGIADLLANQFVISVTCEENIALDHETALKLIFMPTLTEGIQLNGGWVDPSGDLTTWAINTRTSAVTEYSNFEFNSFAQMNSHWLGANKDGLFVLDGPTDDGSNIVAKLKSGLLQLGGSHSTSLKGIYVGMRVSDDAEDFIFKIETGEGKTFAYKMRPKNMATTKINVGKGLRTRYFSFELITPGPDWDLDAIEFVPIISSRRI